MVAEFYAEPLKFFRAVLRANVERQSSDAGQTVSTIDRSQFVADDLGKKTSRAQNLNRRELERAGQDEVVERLVRLLAIPPLSLITGGPWLRASRIEGVPIAELVELAQPEYLRRCKAVSGAQFQGLVNGAASGVFGACTRKPDVFDYTFGTARVDILVDKVEHADRGVGKSGGKVAVKTIATRVISAIQHRHELLSAVFFDFPSTVRNPALQIPPHFLAALLEAPSWIQPYLTGVFGTQMREVAVATEVDRSQVVGQSTVEVEFKPPPPRTLREEGVFWDMEPCVVLGSPEHGLCLIGWGKSVMDETKECYAEHQQVLDAAAAHRDEEARATGAYQTSIRFGAGLIVLIVAVLGISLYWGQPFTALALVPLGCFAFAVLQFAYVDTKQRAAAANQLADTTLQSGYRQLKRKYRDFDPATMPRIPEPNDS